MAKVIPKQNIHDSVLTTEDPYHLPGYGGYCPQLKYQIGNTYGHITSRLLGDESIVSSGKLVLARKNPVNKEMDAIRNEQLNLVRNRKQSWGDQLLVENMTPGYTGFVPKVQNYFGKRYTENCTNAISDFEGNQQVHNQKIAELRLTDALATGRCESKRFAELAFPDITNRYTTPLEPVSQNMKHYVSKTTPRHPISPYYMGNKNPDKHFMSGYTGFVPKARNLLGSGYPVITHMALNEHTDYSKRVKALSAEPVQIHRAENVIVNTKPIYPIRSGLVPHYTGHIPGEQFTCGETFGDSTNRDVPITEITDRDVINSKRQSRPQKRKSGFPMLGRRTSPDSLGTKSPSAPRRSPILTNRQRTPEEAPQSKRTRASSTHSASASKKSSKLPRI